MRYSSLIDNVTSKKWGLSLQEAYLFDWVYTLPSWAEKVIIDSETYYFASRNLACREALLLTDKSDTMYRYYKSLEGKGIIKLIKVEGKDYIKLMPICSEWGRQSEYSEKNPSLLGKKSENNSEKNPTNNIINTNKIISKKESIPPLFEDVKNEFKNKGRLDLAEKFWFYYESNGWKVGRNKMKVWRAAVAQWVAREKKEGSNLFNTEKNKSNEW